MFTSEWLYDSFIAESRELGLAWDNGDWSRRIFTALGNLAKKKQLIASDSIQGGARREWLVDHVWAEHEGWDTYDGLVLACESELKPHWAHILEDAMKLADVCSKHKILICCPALRDTAMDGPFWSDSPIKRFYDYTQRHKWVRPEERYLVIALAWERNEPSVQFRGFAWSKGTPIRLLYPPHTTVAQPGDRLIPLVEDNPYQEPLASRFQLILDRKVRTANEYCSIEIEGHHSHGILNPRSEDIDLWVTEETLRLA